MRSAPEIVGWVRSWITEHRNRVAAGEYVSPLPLIGALDELRQVGGKDIARAIQDMAAGASSVVVSLSNLDEFAVAFAQATASVPEGLDGLHTSNEGPAVSRNAEPSMLGEDGKTYPVTVGADHIKISGGDHPRYVFVGADGRLKADSLPPKD